MTKIILTIILLCLEFSIVANAHKDHRRPGRHWIPWWWQTNEFAQRISRNQPIQVCILDESFDVEEQICRGAEAVANPNEVTNVDECKEFCMDVAQSRRDVCTYFSINEQNKCFAYFDYKMKPSYKECKLRKAPRKGKLYKCLNVDDAPENVIEISQVDFDGGAYVISESGYYKLTEDIVFQPKDTLNPAMPEFFMHPDSPTLAPSQFKTFYGEAGYKLGFFAAVVIAAKDVVLDLNGHSIEQGHLHGMMQRFFSVIELSNAPFPQGAGPASFGDDFRASERVIVRNGRIGSSSHHGIHGNNNAGILLENLDVTDFEVGGIALNGVKNLKMHNVRVHDNKKNIPANHRLSQSIFLLQGIMRNVDLIKAGCDSDALQVHMNNLRAHVFGFINSNGENDDILYRENVNGLPDGSMLTGIQLHPFVDVGPFLMEFPDDDYSSDITMNHVAVENLVSASTEIGALVRATATNPFNGGHMRDNVGGVFEFEAALKHKQLNALHQLQLAVSDYLYASMDNAACELSDKSKSWLGRTSIDPEFSINAKSDAFLQDGDVSVLGHDLEFAQNHDAMFHFVKGVIGVKIAGVARVGVNDLKIVNIDNRADSSRRSIFADPNIVYNGFNTRAMILSAVHVFGSSSIIIDNITSLAGVAMGAEALNDIRDVSIQVSSPST